MTRPRRTLTALAVVSLGIVALGVPTAGPSRADEEPAPLPENPPVLALKAPATQTTYAYSARRSPVTVDVRLVAGDQPIVIHTTRADYDQPVRTVWHRAEGDDVVLPNDTDTLGPLDHFLRVEITDLKTGETRVARKAGCLSGYGSERVRPDAPARSDYPRLGCYANPYALGQVQGLQAGWSIPVLGYDRSLRLTPGRYRLAMSITPDYAAAFGLTDTQPAVSRLIVKREGGGGFPGGPKPVPVEPPHHARAAAHDEPTETVPPPAAGPVPDLRSLPAWGISVSPNGNYLRFSATVWNAGTSPLVVDGFRREGEDEMDAYQYFFDADGEQTGYTPVGQMHWDPKPTHLHWHFEDFARYSLVRVAGDDQQEVVRSRKEAFCLANTDAVDLTLPGAMWNPENTDLSTACGDYSSLSVREVLAAGWGDTYAQFRAGQSFDLKKVPNGVYYIAVIANPFERLTEATLENNTALRRVVIGGTLGKRTVKVDPVGNVVEPEYFF